MKKMLPIILTITLFFGLIPLVSCTCSQEDLAKLPYGEVISWDIDESLEDYFKNHRNQRVYFEIFSGDIGWGEYFQAVDFIVSVRNKGADGILTFQGVCNRKTLGKDEYSQNITLDKDQVGKLTFRFFIDVKESLGPNQENGYTECISVQAVNLHDFVD